MTREDIIRMAQEARLAFDSEEYPEIWQTYMYVGRDEIERFAALVASAEREACAKLCDLAMLQNQEAINELEEDEHIAQCFIQGAMTQLVKTSKAIRARGQA